MAVATPVRPAPVPAKPRRAFSAERLNRWDVKLSPYLYISPFFVIFAVIGAFPLVFTAWVSVHDWNLIRGQGKFVGVKNFVTVLGQDNFWNALGNTFSIFLLSSVPQVVLAITIAALLDTKLRGRTFWRMGVLLPYVVAPVAVSLVFGNLFAEQFGLVNHVLALVGLDPVAWQTGVLPSHLAIATMVNFRFTGYNTLIFLAAMQAIPRDYYEAASIDGASRVRQFFSVTVPLLRPTLVFVVITATIGGLQIFDEPRLFDYYGRGGANRQFQTVTLYLYELGWGQRNFGRASAVALLLLGVILLIAAINFALTRLISDTGTRNPQARTRSRRTR